jgi:hypothetical protein
MLKFNDGRGAIICDQCQTIIAEGRAARELGQGIDFCCDDCERDYMRRKADPESQPSTDSIEL